MYTETSEEEWVPDTAVKMEAVRHQLDLILASSHFRKSKRYPVLLRYVIEVALEGRTDTLKERSLGVAVFQRVPQYDTNNDPIVRITAGEVRKRIAQYYHDPGHDHELLIDLPSGSYVPQFKVRSTTTSTLTVTELSVPTLSLVEDEPVSMISARTGNPVDLTQTASARGWHRSVYLPIAAVLAIAICVVVWAMHRRQSLLDAVWEPLLRDGIPVVVLIPQQSRLATHLNATDQIPGGPIPDALPLTVAGHMAHTDHVVFSDVQALVRITGLIETHHHLYRVQPARPTTFADLRQGPTVLIGGFDNPWTLRALKSARFVFAQDSYGKQRVQDKKDPMNVQWTVDLKEPYDQLSYDYAIVARLVDADTHQPVIIAAGVGENGTKAAAEFLTDPDAVQGLLGSNAPRNAQNFEVVLGTQVVNGVSGPPRILATEIW